MAIAMLEPALAHLDDGDDVSQEMAARLENVLLVNVHTYTFLQFPYFKRNGYCGQDRKRA